MSTCAVCHKEFDDALMRMTENGQVCEGCYQPPGTTAMGKLLNPTTSFGLLMALLPLFITYHMTSSQVENGVGSTTVIQPLAGLFGLAALVAGGLSIKEAMRWKESRGKSIALGVVICLLGLYHLSHVYKHVSIGG